MKGLRVGGEIVRIRCYVNPRDCIYHPDESVPFCLAHIPQFIEKGCFSKFIRGRQVD
jgi:hypothetical protein